METTTAGLNVTLDFRPKNQLTAALNNQEQAIMPAILAKKLLKEYAQGLVSADPRDIIRYHISELEEIRNQPNGRGNKLEMAMEVSLGWIAERQMISEIAKENWDAFKVQPENSVAEHIGA